MAVPLCAAGQRCVAFVVFYFAASFLQSDYTESRIRYSGNHLEVPDQWRFTARDLSVRLPTFYGMLPDRFAACMPVSPISEGRYVACCLKWPIHVPDRGHVAGTARCSRDASHAPLRLDTSPARTLGRRPAASSCWDQLLDPAAGSDSGRHRQEQTLMPDVFRL